MQHFYRIYTVSSHNLMWLFVFSVLCTIFLYTILVHNNKRSYYTCLRVCDNVSVRLTNTNTVVDLVGQDVVGLRAWHQSVDLVACVSVKQAYFLSPCPWDKVSHSMGKCKGKKTYMHLYVITSSWIILHSRYPWQIAAMILRWGLGNCETLICRDFLLWCDIIYAVLFLYELKCSFTNTVIFR